MDTTANALICKLLDLLDTREVGRLYGIPCNLDDDIYLTYYYYKVYTSSCTTDLDESISCKITDYIKTYNLQDCVADSSSCDVVTLCDITFTDINASSCNTTIIISDNPI